MSVGAWFFDLLENAGIDFILFGSLKWAFALIDIGLVLVGLAKAALNRFSNLVRKIPLLERDVVTLAFPYNSVLNDT